MPGEKSENLRGSSLRRLPTADWRQELQVEDENVGMGGRPSLLRAQEVEKDEEDKMHWTIQWAVGGLIIVNAAFLGACTNATDSDTQTIAVCQDAEHAFTAMFLLEFFMKIYIFRVSYFFSGWNWMDFVLLAFSVIDAWILTPVMGSGPQSQMGKGMTLRLFRLLRVLRIFKLLKQRQELLILIEGLGAAFQSMVWVAILLVIVIYGASLFCVATFRDVQTNCDLNFSDVPSAMFTMFTVGTLADWTEIVMPVTEQYVWAGPFFIVFVLLTNFAMLNLVIGVITERTASVNEKYKKELDFQRDQKRLKIVEDLGEMIFDESNRPFITRADLYDIVHNHAAGEQIHDLINEVDLPIGFKIGDLHGMLDRNGTGKVHKQDFVEGMASIMFCTEFQQNCIIQAALASLRAQMRAIMDDAVVQMRAELVSCSLGKGLAPEAVPLCAAGLPAPAAFAAGSGGAKEVGREMLKATEDLLKAVVPDRPSPPPGPAALRPTPPAQNASELNKLLDEISAGCAAWSAMALDGHNRDVARAAEDRVASAPPTVPLSAATGALGNGGAPPTTNNAQATKAEGQQTARAEGQAGKAEGGHAAGSGKAEGGGGPLRLVPERLWRGEGVGSWASALPSRVTNWSAVVEPIVGATRVAPPASSVG